MSSFKHLHRRLSIGFTLLTAAVLGLTLAVTCHMAVAQFNTTAQLLLSTAYATVSDTLADTASISDTWLAQQESANRCLIFIEDNSAALAFPGAWTPRTARSELLEAAKSAGEAAGLDEAARQRLRLVYPLQGTQGDRYTCMAGTIPQLGRRGVKIYLLRSTDDDAAQLRVMYLQYLALWCAGTVLLAVICTTQTKRILHPAEQSQRRQREFVAAAGHELRSPLAVMRVSLQAAQQKELEPSTARLLQTAEAEGERMARLTDDLLLLAGTDAGVWHTAMTPLPMDTFLIELYERFYPLARQKGHTLRLDLPDAPLPALQADSERLEQLFAVLLNNALEYATPATPVEMVARLRRGALTVAVVDHGAGIDDEQKQKIFDRFYRADASHNDKAHFGLGLAVATELAALHRASLTVQDTPGGGATFVVKFNH